MPYNGSGSFSHNGADYPAVSGTTIEASKRNNIDSDIATGLSTAITKDGQTTITANLPMATYRHTGVGNAAARTDYLSMAQHQDGGGVYCVDTGSANAYVIAPSPAITAYAAGQEFRVKMVNACTGASTLNVSALGTKTILTNGGDGLIAGDIKANQQVTLVYDGTNFILKSGSQSTKMVRGFSVIATNGATTATAVLISAAVSGIISAFRVDTNSTADAFRIINDHASLTYRYSYSKNNGARVTGTLAPSGGTLTISGMVADDAFDFHLFDTSILNILHAYYGTNSNIYLMGTFR